MPDGSLQKCKEKCGTRLIKVALPLHIDRVLVLVKSGKTRVRKDLLNVEEFESRRRDMNTLELPFEKEDGNEDALGNT